jgi:hypothetical protein
MNAELVFFGRRVDMAQRQRRRILVVAIYAALAVLLLAQIHWRVAGAYIFWAILLACRLFLGGYHSGGLVKPFNGKGPTRSEAPPPLLLLKLRVYQPVLSTEGEPYRNDERELHQRDHAHYRAYQAIALALTVPWVYSAMRLKPDLLGWIPFSPDVIYYGLLMAILTLALTLPQSILLWTEPDMTEPDLEPGMGTN